VNNDGFAIRPPPCWTTVSRLCSRGRLLEGEAWLSVMCVTFIILRDVSEVFLYDETRKCIQVQSTRIFLLQVLNLLLKKTKQKKIKNSVFDYIPSESASVFFQFQKSKCILKKILILL